MFESVPDVDVEILNPSTLPALMLPPSALKVVPLSVIPAPALYVVFVSVSVLVSVLVIVKLGYVPVTVVAPAPVNETVRSGELLLKVVPLSVIPDPALYVVFVSVFVSVLVIVKLGYVPETEVAPAPVNETV